MWWQEGWDIHSRKKRNISCTWGLVVPQDIQTSGHWSPTAIIIIPIQPTYLPVDLFNIIICLDI